MRTLSRRFVARRIARSYLAQLLGALACGIVAAFGRPGLDVTLAYVLGLWGYLVLVCLATTRLRVLGLSCAFGLGLLPTVVVGSLSWGLIVPTFLFIVGLLTIVGPVTVWTYWAANVLTGSRLFIATVGATSIWCWAVDVLGYTSNNLCLALVAVVPEAMAAVRLVGAHVVEGILTAGLVVSAQALTSDRAGTTPLGARVLKPVAVAVVALAALGGAARATAPQSLGHIRVGIPQVNLSGSYYQSRMLAPSLRVQAEQSVDALLARLDATDLVVFTEGFSGGFPWMIGDQRSRWQEYARRGRQAVILTSYLVEPDGSKSNAAVMLRANGSVAGIHRKVMLAPYGERFLAAGERFSTSDIARGVDAGVLICNETVPSHPAHELAKQGADLLVATTSDSTFKSSALVFEHLALSQLKALETGKSIVWASNAGPSGVISRWGEFVGDAPFRSAAAVRVDAPLHPAVAPYLTFVWFWRAAMVLLLIGGLLDRDRASGEHRAAFESSSSSQTKSDSIVGSSHRSHVRILTVAGALALCAVCGVSLAVLSASFVQLRHGHGSQLEASRDLLIPPYSVNEPGALERFKSASSKSATGAIGYWLEYYGHSHARLDTVPMIESLEAMAGFLATNYGIRTRRVDFAQRLPRVAALARMSDGVWVVTNQPEDADINLFSPVTGPATIPDHSTDADKIRKARGLIPAL